MLVDNAAALLDAYGVEDVPLGGLDLTSGLIGRARAERGDAPPSKPEGKNGIDGPTVRLSPGRGTGRGMATGPIETHLTVPSTGEMPPPGSGRGLGGVRLTAGTAYPLNVFG